MVKAGLSEDQVLKLNTYNESGAKIFTHARIKKDARAGVWKSIIKNYPVIVTLGKTAEMAVKETLAHFYKDTAQKKIFHIPHPSSPGHKFDDAEWHDECVKVLKEAKKSLGDVS
jgi:hypothetical protein